MNHCIASAITIWSYRSNMTLNGFSSYTLMDTFSNNISFPPTGYFMSYWWLRLAYYDVKINFLHFNIHIILSYGNQLNNNWNSLLICASRNCYLIKSLLRFYKSIMHLMIYSCFLIISIIKRNKWLISAHFPNVNF